jgi:hypothetical protein
LTPLEDDEFPSAEDDGFDDVDDFPPLVDDFSSLEDGV